jgi:hypothetical protein
MVVTQAAFVVSVVITLPISYQVALNYSIETPTGRLSAAHLRVGRYLTYSGHGGHLPLGHGDVRA